MDGTTSKRTGTTLTVGAGVIASAYQHRSTPMATKRKPPFPEYKPPSDDMLEQATITINLDNRDLMNALADRIKEWLLEMVPPNAYARVNWTIRQDYTIMDMRDRDRGGSELVKTKV